MSPHERGPGAGTPGGDPCASALLDALPDAVLGLDAELRVTSANAAARTLLGVDPLVGALLLDAAPLVRGTALEGEVRRVLRERTPGSAAWGPAPSGRWFEVAVGPTPAGAVLLVRDTTLQQRATADQERLLGALQWQTAHDALTALPRTVVATARLTEHLATSPAATATMIALNLSRFSEINDAFGHLFGNEVLVEVASVLRAAAPQGAVVVRESMDLFGVLLLDVPDEGATAVGARLLDALRRPLRVQGRTLHLDAALGASRIGAEHDMGHLLRTCDLALHRAQAQGGGVLAWYDDALTDDLDQRMRVEQDLRTALRHPEQLALHYQTSYCLASGEATGAEALLRWQHPQRGPVAPSEVIPVAEASGLIIPLGRWVVGTAAAQAQQWAGVPDFTTWFNVAPRQLASGDVVGDLAAAIERTGLAPERLGVEVTESVLGEAHAAAGAVLAAVKDLGVKIAIDDFGTGYSSMSRLLTFPVDLLKVDRSFVLASDTPSGQAVLRGVVELAHGIGARVVAEGVETPEQLAVLRSTACDSVCGYLFARPLPGERVSWARARLTPPRQRRPVPGGSARSSRPVLAASDAS